jgi:ectoine hydroxylase-related dioxygenase (phytanoyl-CoA dioxygenase family)
MKNITTLKKQYTKNGVIVLPSVFTPEECDEIKRQAYLVQDNDIKKAGYPHDASETAYNKRSLIFFPALANEYINNIRTDERMVELVKEFIGDDVRQINNQIYFRESGDEDQFAWHQDIMFREEGSFNGDVEADYFQTIIAVDDITEENGAIEFIDGSHKTMRIGAPQNLRVFNRGELKGTKYTAKKGDVLVWSVLTVHGSESNKSDKDRMTYMNGFCRTKATTIYPDYLVNGELVKNINPTKIP